MSKNSNKMILLIWFDEIVVKIIVYIENYTNPLRFNIKYLFFINRIIIFATDKLHQQL